MCLYYGTIIMLNVIDIQNNTAWLLYRAIMTVIVIALQHNTVYLHYNYGRIVCKLIINLSVEGFGSMKRDANLSIG